VGTVTVRFGEPIMFESNPVDHLLGRELRNAAVALLEQRIRGLSQRPRAADPAELTEQRTTVSIPPVAKEGVPARTIGLSRMS